MPVLAALASIPQRERLLGHVLESLRPQVDRLHVYLNGYGSVPRCVEQLADEHVLSRENGGAERKLHWAQSWEGIYCSVDDDLLYPAGYVSTMAGWVDRWHGLAIVTGHGRAYPADPRDVDDVIPGSRGIYSHHVREGRWINHGGTGVMAWDTRRVRMPTEWAHRNMLDMQVAVWAQHARVPMWLVPHRANWLGALRVEGGPTIWGHSKAEGHSRRNAMLRAHAEEHGWRRYQVELA